MQSDLDDEAQSWTAAVMGNGDAFASIFDRHGDRVFRHAQRLTATVTDAEDVTAGAFFELWRRRRSVRVVDGSVLPWLLVTTSNLSRNQSRSLRRYRAMLAVLPRGGGGPGADEEALRTIEGEESAAKIRTALEALKPADAALVVLTTFEHFEPTDVAAVLGISSGAARTRLHRARSRLAGVLEELEMPVAPERLKGELR